MKPLIINVAAFTLLVGGVAQADYAQEVVKDRPVAWWRFQDPASTDGATAKDETGRHSGVYHGNTRVEAGVPGIGGKSAKFDGRTGYMEVPNHADFAPNTLTVECWFRSHQVWTEPNWPASATLISKATEGNASGDWVILGGTSAVAQGCVRRGRAQRASTMSRWLRPPLSTTTRGITSSGREPTTGQTDCSWTASGSRKQPTAAARSATIGRSRSAAIRGSAANTSTAA